MSDTRKDTEPKGVTIIQEARSENEVVAPAEEKASQEKVAHATSSCVNHLCGCE